MATKHSRVEKRALKLLPKSGAPSHVAVGQALRDMWEADCEWVRRAKEQLSGSSGNPLPRRGHAQQWWYVVDRVLHDYATYSSAEHPLRIPDELIDALCEMAGYLATGKIPPSVAAVRGRGSPPKGPREIAQIDAAHAYVSLAKQGIIVDKSPIKTVADAYQVHRRTARRWANDTEAASDMATSKDSREVTRLMREAGSEYAKTGRSKAAIWERGRPARK
jgi:hypothetical protein